MEIRILRGANGAELGRWTYATSPMPPGTTPWEEKTTTVTTPLGHRSVH